MFSDSFMINGFWKCVIYMINVKLSCVWIKLGLRFC